MKNAFDEGQGCFLDDSGLQSFSALVRLVKDLMEHSLEKPTAMSSKNFMGIKKKKDSGCPSR